MHLPLDATVASLRSKLEQGLPTFHEVRLLMRERPHWRHHVGKDSKTKEKKQHQQQHEQTQQHLKRRQQHQRDIEGLDF